ncbi:hypothetical protein Avbf_11140 [Armadillidium vulgare]|nr:hypothetical protein Avbf_11140 [Armadillidium vulgare]
MAVPAVIIGIIGKETSNNWEATSFNKTIGDEEKSLILPLVIHHLTPTFIFIFSIPKDSILNIFSKPCSTSESVKCDLED